MHHRFTALPLVLAAAAFTACTTVQPLPPGPTNDGMPHPAGDALPTIPSPDPIEETTPVHHDRPAPAGLQPPTPPPPLPAQGPVTTPQPAPPSAPPTPRTPDPVQPAVPAGPRSDYEPGVVCDMAQGWLDTELAAACRGAFG